MSVRVGHIMRHEDVHGVSGVGKVADVFEATNGKCVVVWISAHSSVNVYDHIKDVETTHSHGGKTLVVWDYESPPDADPMGKVLNGKKPELTDEEVNEIATEAAEEVAAVTAVKVAERIVAKIAEQKDSTEVGPVADEPTKAKGGNGKKKVAAKKAPAKKKE